jgi:glycine/D-amino acid oxidase-like deaminating enzyme
MVTAPPYPAAPPIPGLRRAWWLREALAADTSPIPAPPLSGQLHVDVAIIGGGYTGMWTAWFLGEMAPGMKIAILESDICGGGPSGRNGGFLHGWWEQLPYLVEHYGRQAGLQLATAADEVVEGIGGWCSDNEVDAWFTPRGYLRVNAFPATPYDWEGLPDELARLGAPGVLRHVEPADVQHICASPAFREGLLMASAATIQPARLARGLRRVLLERGVGIHEGTRVQFLDYGRPIRLSTPWGFVAADQVVLAANAWASGWPGFRTRMLAWGSYMVITEQIPDRLREIGWTGGEALADSRFTISYSERLAMAGSHSGPGWARPAMMAASGRPSPRIAAPSIGSSATSATCCRCSPTCGSRMPGAARSTSPRIASRRSAHEAAGACTTRMASPAMGWGPRASLAGPWPPWSHGSKIRSPRPRSSAAGSASCLRSHSATSVREPSGRPSSARTMPSTPAASQVA